MPLLNLFPAVEASGGCQALPSVLAGQSAAAAGKIFWIQGVDAIDTRCQPSPPGSYPRTGTRHQVAAPSQLAPFGFQARLTSVSARHDYGGDTLAAGMSAGLTSKRRFEGDAGQSCSVPGHGMNSAEHSRGKWIPLLDMRRHPRSTKRKAKRAMSLLRVGGRGLG